MTTPTTGESDEWEAYTQQPPPEPDDVAEFVVVVSPPAGSAHAG
jgi:hypothetical protein